MGNFVPYGRQWVEEEDIQAVVDVLRGDYLTTGPLVAAFEDSLKSATGARHAVAVNSGTSALHVAYFAAGLQAGDEIITSPLTFAATSNAALYLGANVRFIDVDPNTGNINPMLIGEAITDKTKLIVPVDFTGLPADYDAIQEIATKHNLKIVADAAHSLGATYKGRLVGALADATELSFHPVKPVTTAEGGAIVTNDASIAKRAAMFRTHGITKDPEDMATNEGGWFYEMQVLGFNYRITDVQCALGVSQMKKLATFIARRRAIAKKYTEAFTDMNQIELPPMLEGIESGWHLYIIRVIDGDRRKALFDKLRELGLGVQVHYIPVHYHPYYQQLGFEKGQFPVAEDYYARAISLPIFPKMSDNDVNSVIERVKVAIQDVL